MDVLSCPPCLKDWYGALGSTMLGLPCIVSDVIPEEAKVSDNFQILSLEEKPAVWAAAACKISTGYRRGTLPNIHLRNLDINFVAKDLEAFYLSL